MVNATEDEALYRRFLYPWSLQECDGLILAVITWRLLRENDVVMVIDFVN